MQLLVKKYSLACLIFLLGCMQVSAQQAAYPMLKERHYYLVAGVFGNATNAEKQLAQAKAFFPDSYIAINPETNFHYVLLDASPAPIAYAKINNAKAVKGFEGIWTFHYTPIVGLPANKDGEVTPTALPPKPSSTQQADTLARTLTDTIQVMPPMESAQVNETARDSTELDLFAMAKRRREDAPAYDEGGQQTSGIKKEQSYTLYIDAEQVRGLPREGFYMAFGQGDKDSTLTQVPVNTYYPVALSLAELRHLILKGYAEPDAYVGLAMDFIRLFNEDFNSHIFEREGDTLRVKLPKNYLRQVEASYVSYFQDGSSVFRPASKYELHQLARYLHEHPHKKISIIGYTNAGGMGRAWKNIHDDFFSISHLTIKQDGMAKDLALDRANAVKRYLVRQGIAAERMSVSANTSRKLFNSRQLEGQLNARAEVILY